MPAREQLPEALKGLKQHTLIPGGAAGRWPRKFFAVEDVAAALSDQEGKLRAAEGAFKEFQDARWIAACGGGILAEMDAYDKLVTLLSTPDQDGDCERIERCPTCLSRNPMFTHCKDPAEAKAETGRDAPPLRDRGPSCTDLWHDQPRADQDGEIVVRPEFTVFEMAARKLRAALQEKD